MNEYHITVLQLLRTKLVCSHFFCSLAQKSSFAVNLEFKSKISICNSVQQILREYSGIQRKERGEMGKKKTKSVLRQTKMSKISLQFPSRKLSQYCRGSFAFSTAPVTAKLWTYERKKLFPTPVLTNNFSVQFELSLRAHLNQRLWTPSNSHLDLYTIYTHLFFPKQLFYLSMLFLTFLPSCHLQTRNLLPL